MHLLLHRKALMTAATASRMVGVIIKPNASNLTAGWFFEKSNLGMRALQRMPEIVFGALEACPVITLGKRGG
jgi:hypothetical protein